MKSGFELGRAMTEQRGYFQATNIGKVGNLGRGAELKQVVVTRRGKKESQGEG